MRSLTQCLRRLVGRVVTQLQSYALEYQQEQRQQYLTSVCRADPTATIGGLASFSNSRGKPENIIIGANSAVLGEFNIFPKGGRIAIGKRTYIGPGTRIWSAESITIGNYVLIAHDVEIHDSNSHSLSSQERREEIDTILPALCGNRPSHDLNARAVVIEDDVWIGFNSVVLKGVRIGRGAIIGASTVVNHDVPPFTLVVGNPMRVVRALPNSSDAL
jgi:maltose O-acetyltransferase